MFRGNLPDEIWSRLKVWAGAQAEAQQASTLEECAAFVNDLAKQLTGRSNSLRSDVVDFYAAETLDMIVRLREQIEGALSDAAPAAESA